MRGSRHVMRRIAASLFVLAFAGADAGLAQSAGERLPLCLSCHGEKGQSETPGVPSLGGQPAMYVLIELFLFREKLRKVDPMTDMAAGLSDAELQQLADAIAKLPPPRPAAEPEPARMERGAALIRQHRCAFCHNNLAGSDNVPRIAAQREDYVLKSLRDYKSGTRHEYQPVMSEVLAPLKDEDLIDLAHFLAHTAAP